MKHRKIITVAVAALLTAGLAGCSSSRPHVEDSEQASENSAELHEARKQLSDGREVTCVIYSGGRGGGLSCDWGGAK